MKKHYFPSIVILFLLGILPIGAQTAREEIMKDINLAGSNHLAYPTPKGVLTPAPEGKTPFYISHYGRHGSRYLCGKGEYLNPLNIFEKADSAGALTDLGKSVKQRLKYLADEAQNRYGELTLLGAQQHRQIAERMYQRFPEVFADSAVIDAKSTVVIRCILSMENALQQLIALNPKLRIRHDASYHDMYYMNYSDRQLESYRWSKKTAEVVEKWSAKQLDPTRFINSLFADKAYVKQNIHERELMMSVFNIASIIQNCESRHTVTLNDIFTFDELYGIWEIFNARWYIGFSHNPINGGVTPYIQRNLLRKIIEEADSCLMIEKPGATLRYGHETMVLPLTFLMEINDIGAPVENIEELSAKWRNYRIFPMATNIQLIFYRKDIHDEDVLVKALLCEEEATLPVKTDCAPYYHWKDVREYYLKKIDNFEKNIKPNLKQNDEKSSFWSSSSLSKRK